MDLGRTSTFSTATTRIITAILLAGFIPGAAACWTDSDGTEYYCYRIILLSVLTFILFSLAILGCVGRQRRITRANQALIQQAHRTANANQGPDCVPPQGVPPPQVAPQYPPPQVRNGDASPYMASVSQPATSTLPPQYVAPSPGVAPIQV